LPSVCPALQRTRRFDHESPVDHDHAGGVQVSGKRPTDGRLAGTHRPYQENVVGALHEGRYASRPQTKQARVSARAY